MAVDTTCHFSGAADDEDCLKDVEKLDAFKERCHHIEEKDLKKRLEKKDEALNMAATKSSEIVKKSFKKEKGKQPVQVEYDKHEDFFKQRLGVIIDEEDKECRCIYSFFTSLSGKKWVTKNKWGPYNEIRKYDIAHHFSSCCRVNSQNRTSFIYVHDDGRLLPSAGTEVRNCWNLSDDARNNIPKRKRKRKKFKPIFISKINMEYFSEHQLNNQTVWLYDEG
ncbi:hypothetical protein E3N88_36871 [Mikania micrantha]|uniref:Uncharacterized protein n=1 Tax=Mikania micrantha TaxID=192012 RepID=A0A5N6M5H4_9ASTR|nr:hypothetical protein E3N88_36871 [Mikania micrantha]